MEIPSQGLIKCKVCGAQAFAHKAYRSLCDCCAKARSVEYQRAYRARQKAKPRIVSCKRCGIEFDASVNGRTWMCPSCIAAYQSERAQQNRERYAEYSRNYRAKRGDGYRSKMVQRRRDKIASMTPSELAEFRKAESAKTSRLNRILRSEVFSAYGGSVCACCGETETSFLSIDHINNDGAEQRRRGDYAKGGVSFYQWLRKNGYPDGYQVLCMNCNVGKHRNGGVCPHRSDKV